MGKFLATSFALLCALALSLPATAAAAPVKLPKGFLGIQHWTMPSPEEFATLGANGVTTYRAQLDWNIVETTRGRRDWSTFDRFMERAAAARVRILPVLLGSPNWAAPRPQSPPNRGEARAAFMRFTTEAVSRYSRGGRFWRERPGLPVVAPIYWQVWNEPNFPVYWYDLRPSPGQYGSFLKETASAIRSGNRRAKVLLGGLPESRSGIPGPEFLRRLYRVRGIKRAFDAVAVHGYAKGSNGFFDGIGRHREVMRRARDSRTPVWVTEAGWSTGGMRSPFTTSERGQARKYRAVIRRIARDRRRLNVRKVIWFALKDRAPEPGEKDWWAIHTGVLRADGSIKPAWNVLIGNARG